MTPYPSDRETDRREVARYPYEIDIEILCGGHEQKCRTSNISVDGLFVRTDDICKANQIVRVRAYVPNVKRPIDWMGRVTRVVTPTQATDVDPAGIAINIFGIADKERVRWLDLLTTVSQQCEVEFDPSVSRNTGPTEIIPPRKHARYKTPLHIDVRSVKQLFRFVARDISAGGVFIPTKLRLEEGTIVSLAIRHPVSGDTFDLDGEVIRCEPNGLAVKFRGITDDRRRELQRFIVSGRARF